VIGVDCTSLVGALVLDAILSVGLLAPALAAQMGQSLAGRDPHLGLFWT